MVDQLQPTMPRTAPEAHPEERSTPRVLPVLVAIGIAALVAGLVVGWLIVRDDGTSDDPSVAMTETIDAWIAATVNQDPRAASQLYSEDAEWYDVALDDSATGRDGVRRAWGIYSDVEDSGSELLAANADTAVMRWWLVGYFDWELEGISVLEFDGDVIVAETVYYDCAQSPLKFSCANM
jgi:hypothetical protein